MSGLVYGNCGVITGGYVRDLSVRGAGANEQGGIGLVVDQGGYTFALARSPFFWYY
jgi:hypothetical protein